MNKYLIYSPLHHFVALVNRRAIKNIQAGLKTNAVVPERVWPIVQELQSNEGDSPAIRTGPLQNPQFLGLIPTRSCNMACRYCDFVTPKQTAVTMSLKLARQALDSYLALLLASGQHHVEIHFFGGEPFIKEEVVHFIVEYAALRATELGLSTHFEAITNGLYGAERCRWIADYFDTIILSLDGPADIQESQRPAPNGQPTFATIARNAKILSEGPVELIIRVCVSHVTVARMAEIARWLGAEFRPSTVCFETLTESPLSRQAGLSPPSPWEFAQHFIEATRILQEYGIETVHSTTNLQNIQASFCPVGKDALIVSPDGEINACYLLPSDWRRNDLDLCLGRVVEDGFEINNQALQRIRSLSVHNKTLCDNCLCRYHCAGGCHVNHKVSSAMNYDNLCIQTRLITIAKLLMQINQETLVDEWLADQLAMEASVMQRTDRLFSMEFEC